MPFEELREGIHLGYRDRILLAILNLHQVSAQSVLWSYRRTKW